MESTGSADFYMAGFQVATYGRFWVAAEAQLIAVNTRKGKTHEQRKAARQGFAP
jgi:hypothetical protein